MPQPDYRGARGSNAGDDFHELWALRQALVLLNPRTRLVAVAVEGLPGEDEHGVPTDTWDGVDCAFYFEGNDVSSAKRIVIDRLKYSSANPEKTWTVSRLTSSSNKKGDNSAIARLAKVFGSLSRMRPDLVASGDLKLDRYAERLVDRIPATDRDLLDLNDIPTNGAQGIARYIYALMSDVDVRVRWRAAHALRSLGRIQELETINSVVALYDQTSELSYRRPDAPFYWLASRLWLLIALDKIASETPKSIGHLGDTILARASDASFPHVLLRSFTKTAVTKLVDNGILKLKPADERVVKRINVSPVPAVTPSSPRDTKFHKHSRPHQSRREGAVPGKTKEGGKRSN